MYANSFYAAMNTRKSVRGRGTENEQTTVPTFLMVGQTTTIKHEGGNDNPILSTVSWFGSDQIWLSLTCYRLFGPSQTVLSRPPSFRESQQ